jgi:hypothetical protein
MLVFLVFGEFGETREVLSSEETVYYYGWLTLGGGMS